MTEDEQLLKLVGWIEEAEESLDESRALSERCRDYYDGDQWTEEELEVLEQRKQPAITINRIAPKVNYLLGMEAEFRQDPKAYPRTKEHIKAADACTDALRYVVDNVDFDQTASAGFANLCIEGTEACQVFVTPGKGEVEVRIEHLHWDRLIYDHHSRRKDFSDSRFMGGVTWMDRDVAQERWPDSEAIEATFNADNYGDTYDDSPRDWVDAGRKRIKIIHMYWRKSGEWMHAVFTKGGFLREPERSIFEGEHGNECPIIAQSAFVDRNGQRYGAVKHFLDIQDEINKRRSKALHMMSTRQTFSSKQAAGEDIDKLKRELARADGHLEFEYGEWQKDFGLIPNGDMIQTQFALLAEAKTEIDAVGTNAAMAGDEERSMSGRALQTRQKGGSLEVAPIFDAHRTWKRRVYRAVWNRIKQFWRSEKWIRVTDEEQNLQWVGLNRPITAREAMQQRGVEIPPFMAQDPRLSMPVGVENNVAEIDVDILVDESPDVVTLQSEQFEQLAQLYQANPAGVPFDIIIEASTLRNKDKILSRLRGGDPDGDPEKVQLYQQLQQMQQILQQAQKELEIAKSAERAKIAETQARLVESERRLKETQIKHETTKLKAQTDAQVTQIQTRADAAKLVGERELAQLKARVEAEKAAVDRAENAQRFAELVASVQTGMDQTQAAQCQTTEQFTTAVREIVSAINAPREKVVSMTVGGKEYRGKVEET